MFWHYLFILSPKIYSGSQFPEYTYFNFAKRRTYARREHGIHTQDTTKWSGGHGALFKSAYSLHIVSHVKLELSYFLLFTCVATTYCGGHATIPKTNIQGHQEFRTAARAHQSQKQDSQKGLVTANIIFWKLAMVWECVLQRRSATADLSRETIL